MMDSDTKDNDFEYARQIYHDILTKGSSAMDDMAEVARSTEHPRAFEVLATTMKTMADVAGNLIDLHKKKKDIERSDEKPAIAATTNNLFIGSTTDLQRFLLNQPKPEVLVESNVIELKDYREDE